LDADTVWAARRLILVDKRFRFCTASILPSFDVFNVMNSNTIQAIRGTQNAANVSHG
jgi:hypothetical protein